MKSQDGSSSFIQILKIFSNITIVMSAPRISIPGLASQPQADSDALPTSLERHLSRSTGDLLRAAYSQYILVLKAHSSRAREYGLFTQLWGETYSGFMLAMDNIRREGLDYGPEFGELEILTNDAYANLEEFTFKHLLECSVECLTAPRSDHLCFEKLQEHNTLSSRLKKFSKQSREESMRVITILRKLTSASKSLEKICLWIQCEHNVRHGKTLPLEFKEWKSGYSPDEPPNLDKITTILRSVLILLRSKFLQGAHEPFTKILTPIVQERLELAHQARHLLVQMRCF